MARRRGIGKGTAAGWLALALLSVGCGRSEGSGPTPSAVVEPADVLYVGGTVLTLDEAASQAEAVAVKDGRVLAVGPRATLEAAHRGPDTRVEDLAGGTLLPGFIDAHGHLAGVGMQAAAANLLPPPDGDVRDIATLQQALRAQSTRDTPLAKTGWIIGIGYDDAQLAERRHPDRDDLDAVSADVPVLVIHQSGHLGAVNGAGLARLGIGPESPDPPGGAIRRRAGSREPDGVLEENALFAALGPVMQALTLDDSLALIEAGQREYARFGFTTAQEGRAYPQQVAALSVAADRGLLFLDVVAYPDLVAAEPSMASPDVGRHYRNHFRIGGGKLSLDGSPQGKTAWLTAPYFVPPEGRDASYAGYPALSDDVVEAKVKLAFEKGWQVLAHANGDAAIDQLIRAVRAATEALGPGDRRTVCIHCQTAREDQLDAFVELGITPSFFGMHTFYWGDWHRDSVLGPERAAHISPAASALARGLHVTQHHDAPVVRPDSARLLASQVNRVTRSGQVLGPDERVTPLDALRSTTTSAAWQYFEEGEKGSIEPGMLADFVVLDRNPLAIPPEELATLQVRQTIKEGRRVYPPAEAPSAPPAGDGQARSSGSTPDAN